jgi:hypothetical protein
VVAIWFKLVDSHIQRRRNQTDEDIIKAENKQAAAPVRSPQLFNSNNRAGWAWNKARAYAFKKTFW